MRLEELDRLLASWKERLARIDDELLALEDDTTLGLLPDLGDLYDRRAVFGEALAEAEAVRRSVSRVAFWERTAKTREILALFASPPNADLEAMERACAAGREASRSVKRAWESLDAFFARTEQRLREIARLADALAEPGTTRDEIAVLHVQLEQAGRDVVGAPLLVEERVASGLGPALDALERRLRGREQARHDTARDLTRAKALREEVSLAHAEAVVAAREARRDDRGPPLVTHAPSDAALALEAQWAVCEELAKVGAWEPAASALERFLEAADRLVQKDRAVTASAEAQRARRGDLRSRLLTRRAQLSELAARGIPEPHERERQDRAAEAVLALLDARPTSLDEAEAQLDAYEQGVIALARRARGV
jgi:hypothetical protein